MRSSVQKDTNYPKRCPVFRKAGTQNGTHIRNLSQQQAPRTKSLRVNYGIVSKRLLSGTKMWFPDLLSLLPPPPPSSNCSFLFLCKVGRRILSKGVNFALGPISCCRLLSPRVRQSVGRKVSRECISDQNLDNNDKNESYKRSLGSYEKLTLTRKLYILESKAIYQLFVLNLTDYGLPLYFVFSPPPDPPPLPRLNDITEKQKEF